MGVSKKVSGQASLPTPNSTNSFWHREPSQVLLGHRTTPAPPTETDVVIIGSGISGTFAAHWLREDEAGKDLNIVMLEAREACWGATGRNGGHCQPLLYSSPLEVGAFEIRNFETLKSLISEHDIRCEWRSLASCHAYMTDALFEVAVQKVKSLQELSPEIAELITVVTKESTNPSLEDLRVSNAAGAITCTKAASLWPYKLIAWVLENLLSKNSTSEAFFNLQTNTPVTHIQKVDEGWITHTPRGMIASKQVLLTTNAYTSHLLPQFSDLIVPVRGEMSSLLPPKSMKPSASNPPLDLSYSFIGNAKQNVSQDDYLIQRPFSSDPGDNGELMFGGGRAYAAGAGLGVSDDSSIDPPAAAYLRRELNLMLDLQNDDEELEATYEWSGIMGYSRDFRPWVGEVTEDLGVGGGKGLWISAGFTGHGMPNTCLSAKAVADLMVGKKESEIYLPSAYRIGKDRVENARLRNEVAVADALGEDE